MRLITSAILILIVLSLAACGSATPTALPPASPTTLSLAQPTQPSVPPTATLEPGAAVPTAIPPTSEPVTPTVAVTATVRPTAKPAATATSAPPKPAAATGHIIYTMATDEAPKFHTAWVAKADGTGARQILTNAYWASMSPAGKHVAYFGRPEGQSAGLYVANADGSNPVLAVIHPGVCCINWSPDSNWIVFAQSPRPNQPGGDLYRVKSDGAYKTILSIGVSGNGPSFSPDGKQIVYSGCVPNTTTCGLMVTSVDGGTPRSVTKDNGGNASWSPRGDKIVYQADAGNGLRQVFVVNVDGSGKKQLTNGKGNDGQPVWSRDGGSIFWRSDQNGTAWGIFVMNADGSNQRRIINDVPTDATLWGWETLSVSP